MIHLGPAPVSPTKDPKERKTMPVMPVAKPFALNTKPSFATAPTVSTMSHSRSQQNLASDTWKRAEKNPRKGASERFILGQKKS
jgi:hypothetical protein